MLDCRGNKLNAGDTVSVAWTHGHVYGTLVYDPDDIRYKTLRVREEDGYVRNTKKVSSRVLNISALIKEQLDRPVVRVLQ